VVTAPEHGFLLQTHKLRSRVYRFFWRFTRNAADAADLTQETYLRLARLKPADIPPLSTIPAFVMQTALRIGLDWRKRRHKSPVEFRPDEQMPPDRDLHTRPPDSVDAIQELERINDVFVRLPERCRRVFDLSAIQGFSFKKIAALLNISAVTARRDLERVMGELDAARTREV
jgi:RNA polymerase sigma factor (sigma-70 family)